MRPRYAAAPGEPEVRKVEIADSNGRTYVGWLCVRKAPYLHDWPPDARGHKVALDRRLPWLTDPLDIAEPLRDAF